MKYPKAQFDKLTFILNQLSIYIDIKSINDSRLHYLCYQQISEGQEHNHIYSVNGSLKRYHQLEETEKENAVKVVTGIKDFKLYPNGCNDDNIETAIRKAKLLIV